MTALRHQSVVVFDGGNVGATVLTRTNVSVYALPRNAPRRAHNPATASGTVSPLPIPSANW